MLSRMMSVLREQFFVPVPAQSNGESLVRPVNERDERSGVMCGGWYWKRLGEDAEKGLQWMHCLQCVRLSLCVRGVDLDHSTTWLSKAYTKRDFFKHFLCLAETSFSVSEAWFWLVFQAWHVNKAEKS